MVHGVGIQEEDDDDDNDWQSLTFGLGHALLLATPHGTATYRGGHDDKTFGDLFWLEPLFEIS